MIHLDSENLQIVKKILSDHVPGYEVRVFGSRVHGITLKKYSDLDLVIMSKTPLGFSKIGELKEAFSESDLPIKVDVLDWSDISENFQSKILEQFEIIQSLKTED